jgi:hypothetical protein
MTYKRFQALLSLATVKGLNLITMNDFNQFAKMYSNIKTENLQKATA